MGEVKKLTNGGGDGKGGKKPRFGHDEFINMLEQTGGQIGKACKQMGISRMMCWRERRDFPDFGEVVEELSLQMVRDKLVDIMNGDAEANTTSAVIFYLKCKGKKHGWSEKADFLDQKTKDGEVQENLTTKEMSAVGMNKKARDMINRRKAAIVKLLKQQDKYKPELELQAEMTATIYTRLMLVKKAVFSNDYRPVAVQYSREGNRREEVSKMERLMLEYSEKLQSSLRALGMNVDSKVQKDLGSDGFNDFLNAFGDEEE